MEKRPSLFMGTEVMYFVNQMGNIQSKHTQHVDIPPRILLLPLPNASRQRNDCRANKVRFTSFEANPEDGGCVE